MEDVLKDRRLTGDWSWVTRDWSSPVYHLKRDRDSEGIKNDILRSKAVQHVIDQLSAETGRNRNEFVMDAIEVLDQMGHMFTMKAIRFFGLLLAKTMKRIYRSINVNVDGIEAVRRLVPRYPILLMPTHRSYVDFLVVSYVFYHYNLPLPVVAAGQDFVSMKVMGRLMRHAGAFFIRRSFGSDRLYWSLFQEYIRTHVVGGDAPLEFFVEGTRSRSGKSLSPKFGLLTAALEPFFKSDVLDIVVFPISISYDRTLEENLYAYEVLGVPKPKESTSGLFDARRILGDDYGNVQMIIGEPISIRQFCGTRIDRSVHNCWPKHLSPLTADEHKIVKELAFHVLDRHQKALKLSPFVLIAAALVAHVRRGKREVPLQQLLQDVIWLLAIVERLEANISWNSEIDPSTIVREECKVHQNIVSVTGDEEKSVRMLEVSSSSVDDSVVPLDLQGVVVGHILLSHYSNHLLNVFLPQGLLALILLTKSSTGCSVTIKSIRPEYDFLKRLLQFEFVFYETHSTEVFDRALSFLSEMGTIFNADNGEIVVKSDDKLLHFLALMFEPILLAYGILCTSLLESMATSLLSSKVIAKRAQAEAARFLLNNVDTHQHCILSLELLSNGVCALHGFGALEKDTTNGTTSYRVVYDKLLPIASNLDKYLTKCGNGHSNKSVGDKESRAKL